MTMQAIQILQTSKIKKVELATFQTSSSTVELLSMKIVDLRAKEMDALSALRWAPFAEDWENPADADYEQFLKDAPAL